MRNFFHLFKFFPWVFRAIFSFFVSQFSCTCFLQSFVYEVLKEPIFACLANRDFNFCSRTITRTCYILYHAVFTMEKDNMGERLREIVKKSENIQEVWNECILLQKHCSADSRIDEGVADMIL